MGGMVTNEHVLYAYIIGAVDVPPIPIPGDIVTSADNFAFSKAPVPCVATK